MENALVVTCFKSCQELQEHRMAHRFSQMSFWLSLVPHEPVKVTTCDVWEHHDYLLLSYDQFFQRHDILLVFEFVVEVTLESDVVDQIFLNDLITVHALEANDLLGECVSCDTHNSNHTTPNDATN